MTLATQPDIVELILEQLPRRLANHEKLIFEVRSDPYHISTVLRITFGIKYEYIISLEYMSVGTRKIACVIPEFDLARMNAEVI